MNAWKRPSRRRFVPRIVFAVLLSALGLSVVALSYSRLVRPKYICLRCGISKQQDALTINDWPYAWWSELKPTPVYEFAGREINHHEHEFIALLMPAATFNAPNSRDLRINWVIGHTLSRLHPRGINYVQREWSGFREAIRKGILLEEDREMARLRCSWLYNLRIGQTPEEAKFYVGSLRSNWDSPPPDPSIDSKMRVAKPSRIGISAQWGGRR
jgi:hypothetical protein